MKKPELPIEHINRINYAVLHALDTSNWELINLLSGGLSGASIYHILADNKQFVIKLDNSGDKNCDLKRSYKILNQVSKQGISPRVHYTNAEQGIIFMEYIEPKPRPTASPQSMQKIVDILKILHGNSFSDVKPVTKVLNEIYQRLPYAYIQKSIIEKCMISINKYIHLFFDQEDTRSCHADLNPANILFDGVNYFLIDWHAASPQSFYFDLAYYATWFYFSDEDLTAAFLACYLNRKASAEENAKYYLMRIFSHVYLGVVFLSLPLQKNMNFPPLSEQEISHLPSYPEFMQSLAAGKINLANEKQQQILGYIFLKTAEKMMTSTYHNAYELLDNSHLK